MRKIISILVSVGLGLIFFTGNIVNKSPAVQSVAAATIPCITVSIQPQSFEEIPDQLLMPSPLPFHFLNEDQIAAHEIHQELRQEIHKKYAEQHAELLCAYQSELEEANATILGNQYIELQSQIKALREQYKSLSNDFYKSNEYISLKTEFDALMAELVNLEKESDAYKTAKEQLDAAWGKISVLVGELNSQRMAIRVQKMENKSNLIQLINGKKAALDEQFEIITKKFLEEAQAIRSNLRMELKVFRQTLIV